MKKLKSKRGETLIETLVTILIIALSMGLLIVMTFAAVKFNQSADKQTGTYYEQLTEAEENSGARSGTAVIGGDLERTGTISMPIEITGEDDELRAYRKEG